MTNPSKVFALAASLIFSHSASAVIIEGSFYGQVTDLWSENMESRPDADFWANATYGYLNGTFWYDTELAGPATMTDGHGYVSATYAGPQDWLHTTVTINGHNLDLTSAGGSGTYSTAPTANIAATINDSPAIDDVPAEHDEIFSLSYDDVVDQGSQRVGSLGLSSSEDRFLNGFSLIQNASVSPIVDGFNVLGAIYFNERCNTDDCNYSAFLAGEINSFDIHVRTPEPSPLLLLLGSLGLLACRARFNQVRE